MRLNKIKHFSIVALTFMLAACSDGSIKTDENDTSTNGGSGTVETTTYTISGTIENANDTITLALDGSTQSFSGGSFIFTDVIEADSAYTVTIESSPTNQTCSISNSSGTATSNVSDLVVTCEDDVEEYTVSGTLEGSTGEIVLSLNGTTETFSGSSFAFANTVSENDNYSIIVYMEPENQTCSITNGTGTATSNIENVSITCQSTNSDEITLCSDHSIIDSASIGNSVFEFTALDGDCFGLTQDFSIVKKEIPVSSLVTDDPSAQLSVSSNVKVTGINFLDENFSDTRYRINFSFEITNNSDSVYCGVDPLVNLYDEEGNQLFNTVFSSLLGYIMGDTYYGEITAQNPNQLKFYEDCIPPHETRFSYGPNIIEYTGDEIDKAVSATVTLGSNTAEVNAESYFFEPLTPVEVSWSTERIESGSLSLLTYTVDYLFTNSTAQSLVLYRPTATSVFLDDDGYLISTGGGASVQEYLDVDEDDLIDSDYLIPASGGTKTFRTYNVGYGADLASTLLLLTQGRASKVAIKLDMCASLDSQEACQDMFE